MSTVKVATLNLFNRSGEWGHRAPLVIDQLEQVAPDVIGLQEVDLTLDQGMWISRQINKRMAERPHYRIKHAANTEQRASFHSIATLSTLLVRPAGSPRLCRPAATWRATSGTDVASSPACGLPVRNRHALGGGMRVHMQPHTGVIAAPQACSSERLPPPSTSNSSTDMSDGTRGGS